MLVLETLKRYYEREVLLSAEDGKMMDEKSLKKNVRKKKLCIR